jgi:uncharacterized lipoprotein NlpE involved in copper resistance
MKNLFIVGALIVVLAAGYFFVSTQKRATTSLSSPTLSVSPGTTTTMTNSSLVLGSFKGILPCADCPGIDTELKLVQLTEDSAEGTYTMKSRYLERNVEPYVEAGTWTTLRGTKKDPNATVYQLTAQGQTGSQYFLQVNDDQLKMLDSEQNEIESTMNYTLTKQPL